MNASSRAPVAWAALVALLLALVLAGCGGGGQGSTPAPTHNDADVTFATEMIPHHQQAVEMSDLLLAKTDVSSDVRDLAGRIKAAQAPEIGQMSGWLQAWGAPVPSLGGMGGMGGMHGDGMLTPDELDALAKAHGSDARRRFLQGMVGHHEGAVAMARTEQTEGLDAGAKALASSIVDSQEQEIGEMEQLLGR